MKRAPANHRPLRGQQPARTDRIAGTGEQMREAGSTLLWLSSTNAAYGLKGLSAASGGAERVARPARFCTEHLWTGPPSCLASRVRVAYRRVLPLRGPCWRVPRLCQRRSDALELLHIKPHQLAHSRLVLRNFSRAQAGHLNCLALRGCFSLVLLQASRATRAYGLASAWVWQDDAADQGRDRSDDE